MVASIDTHTHTHTHADHITGSVDLSCLTECKSMMGIEIEAQFIKYKFRDNELLTFGDLVIRALHTPGHTPDFYSFLLEERVFYWGHSAN